MDSKQGVALLCHLWFHLPWTVDHFGRLMNQNMSWYFILRIQMSCPKNQTTYCLKMPGSLIYKGNINKELPLYRRCDIKLVTLHATCEWVFMVILLLECSYPSPPSPFVFLPHPPPLLILLHLSYSETMVFSLWQKSMIFII